VGSIFQVKLSVATQRYLVSGVQVLPSLVPSGVTLLSVHTTRHDGETMVFPPSTAIDSDTLTLGNLVPTHGRSATYFFRADTAGPKTFFVRAWSENGGDLVANTAFQVQPLTANLIETAMGTSPSSPTVAPGATFAVTDTVQNLGPGPSGSSRTRYYVSLDAVKGAGDTLLTGTHSVPGLAAGASHTATVTLTVPASVALDSYFLLACADDQGAVAEGEEGDNCIASQGATVTVTRSDLVASAVADPPATAARGAKVRVIDTARNLGAVAAPASRTRYYLSVDGVKSASDTLLTGSRSVPGLAAGASHSGSVTVAIPKGTTAGTYFLLACADDMSAVIETFEANNCAASGGTVTVAP
jgi:hypothetical protein